MKKCFFLSILLVIILTGSCEKVTLEPDTDIPDNISYSLDIQPIFDANCTKCHGGSRSPDLRADYSYDALTKNGYIDTAEPDKSFLYTTLNGSHDSRANAKEKLVILGWIQQGAKNN